MKKITKVSKNNGVLRFRYDRQWDVTHYPYANIVRINATFIHHVHFHEGAQKFPTSPRHSACVRCNKKAPEDIIQVTNFLSL